MYRVEYRGNCQNDGGWRQSISWPARTGFATKGEAEQFLESDSHYALVYRILDANDEVVFEQQKALEGAER